jgi:HK97 family phage major capsid protein
MNRLKEIEARLESISQEIETGDAEITAEQITVLETEVNALKQERTALIAANEQRSALLASIANGRQNGQTVWSFTAPEREHHEDSDPLGSAEYRKAFMDRVLRGTPIPAEFRADEVTFTTDVGAAIPTTVLNTIIEKMESVGMILPLVTRTAYKGGLSIPTSTVKPVASWVAEGAGNETQKKTAGNITFSYYKLRCAVAVSLETDTMALSAFESTLINNIVEAMTKAIEQAIISGTGTGRPTGILSSAVPAERIIASVAPSYDDLIAAESALEQVYENGALWCMSKKTFMRYYGITDENGQPIGRVNYGIAGKPERSLLGRPVVVCDYVSSYSSGLADGTTFAFLFNFKDYILNTNYNMGLKKYEDNNTDDLVTKAIMLADGKAVNSESLVLIRKD